MRTTINLQEPFTYSFIPLIITFLLIIGFTIYIKFSKKSKDNVEGKMEEVKVIPERNIKNIPVIKNKYLRQLNDIEDKYTNEKIKLRKAYQLISEAIRLFVFEVTDIKTQNYSLNEIKKINIPVLYELIEEYYEPEFASKTIGDFNSSINKARRVINEWK